MCFLCVPGARVAWSALSSRHWAQSSSAPMVHRSTASVGADAPTCRSVISKPTLHTVTRSNRRRHPQSTVGCWKKSCHPPHIIRVSSSSSNSSSSSITFRQHTRDMSPPETGTGTETGTERGTGTAETGREERGRETPGGNREAPPAGKGASEPRSSPSTGLLSPLPPASTWVTPLPRPSPPTSNSPRPAQPCVTRPQRCSCSTTRCAWRCPPCSSRPRPWPPPWRAT